MNFGISETGLGTVEPAGDEFHGNDQLETETTPVSAPEVIPEQTPPPQHSEQIVQDVEPSPVKEKQPDPELIRQQELERQRQAELLKQREEEERRRRQLEEIDSRAKSAFGNVGVGTTEGSEGVTSGTGNQGTPGGTPGAPDYRDGGGLGSGISYGLGDRKVRGSLPIPILSGCVVTQRIVVRVQINVDQEGNVVGTPRILESTYQDDCIYRAVTEAASKATFNADPNAAFRQQGWIRYIIEP